MAGIGSPIEVTCDKDTVYIIDFNDNKVIERVKFSTGDVLGREVGIGTGPGEIIPPIRMMLTDDSIFVHSMSMQKMMSAPRGALTSLKDKGTLPPESSRVFALNNNEFVMTLVPFGPFTDTGDARFAMTDNSLNRQYTFGSFPRHTPTDQKAEPAALAMFHQVTDIHRLSQDKFVAVGQYEISYYGKGADGKYELINEVVVEPYDYEIIDAGENRSPKVKRLDGYKTGIVSSIVIGGNVYLAFFRGTDDESVNFRVYDSEGRHIANIEPNQAVNAPIAVSDDGEIIGLQENESTTLLVKSGKISL